MSRPAKLGRSESPDQWSSRPVFVSVVRHGPVRSTPYVTWSLVMVHRVVVVQVDVEVGWVVTPLFL